ncbi:MAG: isocitrate lyase/phosphoenolpyruvate mutase family protein [Pseudomonadota bacterium]
MTQAEKANLFKSLHVKGDPLTLYNIWDAGGAKALAEAGAKSVATGSWSVAAAQGFADGEAIPLPFLLQIVERIAASVDIPVSVDFEGGYAVEPEGLMENIRKLISAGAIGINFEDRVVQGEGLYPVAKQVERIKAIRAAANQANVPLFINARTDVFLKADASEHEARTPDAIERGAAYAEAGADGFFVPGLTQKTLIEQIVGASSLPVNVMMRGDLKSVSDVAKTGISRASFGPAPYANAMTDLVERFKNLT